MKRHTILALTDKEVDKLIKITGTQYDRRRKLTDKQIRQSRKLHFKKGKSFEEIALKFGVDHRTIRYHLDSTYRNSRILQATSAAVKSAVSKKTTAEKFENRVAYKRQLVARGRVSV